MSFLGLPLFSGVWLHNSGKLLLLVLNCVRIYIYNFTVNLLGYERLFTDVLVTL